MQDIDQKGHLTFDLQFNKLSNNEQIKKVFILLGFQYYKKGVVNYGVVNAEVSGYDLSEAVITGWLRVSNGATISSVIPTS